MGLLHPVDCSLQPNNSSPAETLLCGDAGHFYGLTPIQQQIVVIEYVVTLFGGDISGKEAFQLGFPLVAPGESRPASRTVKAGSSERVAACRRNSRLPIE
jgi:hypothetical protein